ncbi:MAG TPA: hypothetical protein DCP31_39815 [Cyanobacteria bacterium UBA8543]|nr:hypothetical protein [Cyanobacteria bacterium UBA8543]
MKSLKSLLIVSSSVGLIFLGACSNSNQTSNPDNNSKSTKPAESVAQAGSETKKEPSNQPNVPQKGGQVIEFGSYHLEFVPVKEDNGTHLDFYLQKGDNHEAIPNAKVTAQVQLPDGTQKTLNLTYDAADKHYAALLPGKVAGQHQVKMIADVNGEKVNGRFTFNQ